MDAKARQELVLLEVKEIIFNFEGLLCLQVPQLYLRRSVIP